jgi:hypothetical protein
MLLNELFGNDAEVLNEAARVVFSKKGNRISRRYRCTTGSKRGRTVQRPSSCGRFKTSELRKKSLSSKGFRKLKLSSIKNRLKGYRSQKAKSILGKK